MRIVVVDFAASEGGALSILKDFANYVKFNGQSHEWIFLLSDYHIEEQKNIKVKIIKNSKIRRIFFDDFIGAKIVKNLDPNVILNFQNTYIKGVETSQVIYLHQAIPFQNEIKFSFLKRKEFKYAVIQNLLGKRIVESIKRANGVIVQTEWMKEAVLNMTNVLSDHIYVLPPHIDIDEYKKNLSNPVNNLFFYPTGDEIYKNLEIIEEASNLINNLEFKVEVTIDRNLNNRYIDSVGQITREEVYNMYQKSILLFPSKIETFGMPLAEAREFNCIILASDTEFSREILEDYNNAYFFDPNDSHQLSTLMEKCINLSIKQNKADLTEMNSLENNNGWDSIMNVLLDYGENYKTDCVK